MNETPTIVWFRHDLRLTDNPALGEAIKCGLVIPIYIGPPKRRETGFFLYAALGGLLFFLPFNLIQ